MEGLGNKEILSKNLRTLMERFGKDRNQVCADLDFKYTTFTDWYNGNKYPRIDKIEQLANYFGVQKSDLIEDKGGVFSIDQIAAPANLHSMPSIHRVPRLGTIACGEPILAEQNIEDYDEVPDWVRCDFTLVCKGDSMTGARIFDGDIVCIKQQQEVQNGQIAAVLVDDEATLKRVRYIEGGVALWPENPAYAPMVYTGETAENVRILGLATHFISMVK